MSFKGFFAEGQGGGGAVGGVIRSMYPLNSRGDGFKPSPSLPSVLKLSEKNAPNRIRLFIRLRKYETRLHEWLFRYSPPQELRGQIR